MRHSHQELEGGIPTVVCPEISCLGPYVQVRHFRKDIEKIENVHRRTPRMGKDLEPMPYEDGLKEAKQSINIY